MAASPRRSGNSSAASGAVEGSATARVATRGQQSSVRQRTERAATTDDNPVSVEEPPGRVTGRDWSGEMSIT
jgi:hypothetical protein